jgi:hypothetical protein
MPQKPENAANRRPDTYGMPFVHLSFLFRGALGDNLFANGAQLMGPMTFTP